MLSSVLQSSTIPLLEQVANFSQSRHNVLAGNLANIDTPGYHTRDLSPQMFQERLRAAIDERNQSSQPTSLAPMEPQDPIANVRHSLQGMLFHDNNNRSLEQEVAAIAENELQHSMAISLMSSQFKLLDAAVSESLTRTQGGRGKRLAAAGLTLTSTGDQNMFAAIDASTSALVAQRVRMDAITGNIANMSTTHNEQGAVEAYQPRFVIFQTDESRGPAAAPGVKVSAVEVSNVEPRYKFQPGHPDAIKEGQWAGYVAFPNIDLMSEMVNAIGASRAYEANVSVIEVSKNLLQQSLKIIA